MATAVDSGTRSVSIGRVFQRAFSAIREKPVVILGFALMVGAVPAVVTSYAFRQVGLPSMEELAAGTTSLGSFAGGLLAAILVGTIISGLVQAGLTRAVVSASEGGKVSFGQSLSTAFRSCLPLLLLSILLLVGLALGSVIVIGGIILLLMWAVAVPVLVIERIGVIRSFGRSSQLTKGSRWKILGIFALFVLIYSAMGLAMYLVGLGGMDGNSAEFTFATR
jgi:hypothetical protein